MRPALLLYLYRRRLRAQLAQELLAGLGVAIAVALLFAVTVADGSVEGSAGEVLHAVIGPAQLQLRARGGEGFDGRLLARVEALPGVGQAAGVLEQTASVRGPGGERATVQIAGANLSLALLDGLAHTIPLSALSAEGIGLSAHTAATLGAPRRIALELRGRVRTLAVSAVLGASAFGALASAPIAVMGLAHLQRLAGLPGLLTRILVLAKPGREARVRTELAALAGPGLAVAPAGEDRALLHQALRPSEQSSEFFAAICALLGFLFAFNAILLTLPERRHVIADLRLLGARGSQIAAMVLFEALCLGLAASLLGVLAGYALAVGPFHQSPTYLAEAFTLGTGTVIGAGPLALALGGGLCATLLASALALLDRRASRTLDTTPGAGHATTDVLARGAQLRLALAAGGVLALASATFLLWSSLSLAALSALALVCLLAVPLALGLVLHAARALAVHRRRGQGLLAVALLSLRGSTLRSLALASTGAVALFGAGALGGARADLLRGIDGFARAYSADAQIWVNPPGAYQATVPFAPGDAAARIARVGGVAGVSAFYGGYLDFDGRRVWIIARPPDGAREVLRSQIAQGNVSVASAALAAGGSIVLSRQIAAEHHTGVGGALVLPTPSGPVRFRIAATTTNLGWSPGAIFVSAADYRRYWSRNTARSSSAAPPNTAAHPSLCHPPEHGHPPGHDRPPERGHPPQRDHPPERGADRAGRRAAPGRRRRARARADRARTRRAGGTPGRAGSRDRTGARERNRCARRRRAEPARGDRDAAEHRRDPRAGERVGLGALAAPRGAGRAAPDGCDAHAPGQDPAARSGAAARRRLRHRRTRRGLRPGRNRPLPARGDRLPTRDPGSRPASAGAAHARARGRARAGRDPRPARRAGGADARARGVIEE